MRNTASGKALRPWALCAALLPLALLLACATPAPQSKADGAAARSLPPAMDYVPLEGITIADRFDVQTLSAATVRESVRACLPHFSADAQVFRDLKLAPERNRLVVFSHVSSSKRFLLVGNQGLCLEQSASRYPIYAAEVFEQTANVTGVPPETLRQWYRQMALELARSGMVKVIYQTPSGSAYVVKYWTEGSESLRYSYQFKKPGEWETEKRDFLFTHPELGDFSVMSHNKVQVKRYPFEHRHWR